jgi:glycosyltransferase involved in cell wall biosynthesis
VARILFVSGYWPPLAPVGAVRPPKQARHWTNQGHEVRVLAVRNLDLWAVSGNAAGGSAPPPPANRFGQPIAFVPDPVSGADVAHLPWRDEPEAPASAGPAGPASPAGPAGAAGPARPAPAPVAAGPARGLRGLYQALATTPDRYGRWVRAWSAPAAALARAWGADLISASGPPQCSHQLASAAARGSGVPWIAELRDLWVGNPYVRRPWPLDWWSARLADRALPAAAGFVTVTEGAAAAMRARYGKPVEVAMNGFDPEDHAGPDAPAPLDPERLTIIHAGTIYAGRRDARPLLEAMVLLAPDERARISVHFWHDEGAYVTGVVRQLGLEPHVTFHGLVPRREILAIERRADVMLLCRWDAPEEDAVIPGKLFEYIGARRPILSVGSTRGEAADIVRAGPFGLVSNQPAEIAAWLRDKLAEKALHGRLPDLPAAAVAPYDRALQFAKVDAFARRLGVRL